MYSYIFIFEINIKFLYRSILKDVFFYSKDYTDFTIKEKNKKTRKNCYRFFLFNFAFACKQWCLKILKKLNFIYIKLIKMEYGSVVIRDKEFMTIYKCEK